MITDTDRVVIAEIKRLEQGFPNSTWQAIAQADPEHLIVDYQQTANDWISESHDLGAAFRSLTPLEQAVLEVKYGVIIPGPIYHSLASNLSEGEVSKVAQVAEAKLRQQLEFHA